MTDALEEAIDKYNAARAVYRAACEADEDDATLDKKWELADAAETVVMRFTCQSPEDIQAKVRFILADDNAFDSVANCNIDDVRVLAIFLQSLLLEEAPWTPQKVEDAASMDFEPWTDTAVRMPTPTQWHMLREGANLALGLMYKTKADMIAGYAALGGDAIMSAVDELTRAADILDAVKSVIEDASTRMMIALATVACDEGTEGGDE